MTNEFCLTQDRKESNVFGIAIFILDPDNRVLTFKEKEAKSSTGKKVGDYSVLCETRKPGENWLRNMRRGLIEELGLLPETNLKNIMDFSDYKVWETGFIKGAWGTVAVYKCSNPLKLEQLMGLSADPDGVEIVGWKTKEEFEALPLRTGVRNLMNKFVDSIFDNGRSHFDII